MCFSVRLPVVTKDEKTEFPLIDGTHTVPLELTALPTSSTFTLFDRWVINLTTHFLGDVNL